ncbi:hypothetical protein FSP39_005541 [Pinctada imbricata]|uniref:Origin recognition complex subunit 3 n=1 Tax=Pinctada imbricata TaxID=66713 RepID=A0AA88XXA2_PINIB|nr:hypothetical protein FSP39_005541 [Pinctada imbricata]
MKKETWSLPSFKENLTERPLLEYGASSSHTDMQYSPGMMQSSSQQIQSSPSSTSSSQLVDLVPGRSMVKISTAQLHACQRKAKGSGTAMARLLLVVYFDLKTLQESCARGTGTTTRQPLNPDIVDAIIGTYFKECDLLGTWKKRLDTQQSLWDKVDTQIQILRADLNSQIFEDLLAFAKSAHSGFTLDREKGASTNVRKREIPTAALVTGVNTPDHGVMFSNLVTSIKERVSPLVATLKSKDCNNVKNVLSKTLGQILQNPQLFTDEEGEILTSKNIPCTLSTLVSWYKEKFQKRVSSPQKRKSSGQLVKDTVTYPPVVIVFEDLESFLPHVLQDFIAICRTYLEQLPLVFVFGIATSVSAVHRLLPSTVSSMLCMEKFQAPPSSEYLTLVINKILMTAEYPFKLGPRVFPLLLDIFLYHDFSVLNFIKGLQFSMLDHYFTLPISHLCCPEEEVKGHINKLSKKELDRVCSLQSFRRYVESCEPEKQIELLTDEKSAKAEITAQISELHQYHKLFFPVLRCLHVLVCKLPKHPLGKQLREVYVESLTSSVCDAEPYKEALDLLRLTSKEELTEKLREVKDILSTDLPSRLSHLSHDVDQLLQKFEKLNDVKPGNSTEEEDEGEASVLQLQKTDLHSLKKKLQEAGQKKKKLSPYEKLRKETVDYFDGQFREYLKCPKSFPLYEIFYYDSGGVVRCHLNASPRSSVQMALSSPAHYLQCDCCKGEKGSIEHTMPDVCIVYKLHLECTQLINLYDWLQAFVTVVTSDHEDSEEAVKNPDKELQARFIRAVSELQFLGFVKPTKQKTDHVARLTWGGC